MPRRPRWTPKPPPGLRPKLSREQVRDLGLCHHENVQAIRCGDGTPEILYQMLGGAYTWMLVAEHMARRYPEQLAEPLRCMQAVVVAGKDMADRYRRTGRVAFTGPELEIARQAAEWMDALAEQVDRDVAMCAAEASEQMLQEIAQQQEATTA